jgi:PAS domain S-box-containing protein
MSAAPSGSSIAPDPQRLRATRSRTALLIAFAVLTVVTVALSYVYFQQFARHERLELEGQLASISALKVNELEQWRNERQGDGEVLFRNPAFSATTTRFLHDPDDVATAEELRAWLRSYQVYGQYDRVFLLDEAGQTRLAEPAGYQPSPLLAGKAEGALRSGALTFVDLYDDGGDGAHLALLIPLFERGSPARASSVLVLRIATDPFLHPFIERWPGVSSTAETLLVRRDGDSVLFLNDLRFDPHAALQRRVSLDQKQVLAVRAALGETGVVEGLDYRGAQVLGVLAPVPGSPWILVTRMDLAELDARLRPRLWGIVAVAALVLFGAGTAMSLIVRDQRLRHYRRRLELSTALGESEERLRVALLAAQRLTRLYAALSQCNEAIVRCSTEDELFPRVCDAAVTHGGMAMAWIGLLDEAAERIVPACAFGEETEQLQGFSLSMRADDPLGQGPTATAVRETRPVWSEDLPRDASTAAWRQRSAGQRWAASGALPLTRKGQAVGALSIYVRDVESLDADAQRLLKEMATDISFALDGFARDAAREEIALHLRESEQRYRTLFADSSLPMLLLQPEDGRLVDANQAATRFYGFSLAELRQRRISDINVRGAEGVRASLARVEGGKPNVFEVQHRLASGELRDVESYVSGIVLNGTPRILSSIVDVTARTRAERALQASLHEQEALLKEVHHRVKNNLQVIASLLRLEARRSAEPGIKAVLDEMQGRIQSMALLHETLYRSDTLAEVDLSVYLSQLAQQLFRASAPKGRVTLELQLCALPIALDQAIPCGLLVNELLSNCLKHGFPGELRGAITLSLAKVGEGPEVALAVRDTGAGLPADLDARRAGSLGLQLVSDLSRQLRGTLSIESAGGASFELRFIPRAPSHQA